MIPKPEIKDLRHGLLVLPPESVSHAIGPVLLDGAAILPVEEHGRGRFSAPRAHEARNHEACQRRSPNRLSQTARFSSQHKNNISSSRPLPQGTFDDPKSNGTIVSLASP